MNIKTLESTSSKHILSVFNQSFADYFIPFKLTEKQLELKMVLDKTNLSLSVGVFDNERLVGFILHGLDKINNQKVVYNGGTGVIPEKRGSGLTKKMYQFILPILNEKGVKKVMLEVISENIQAISSYKKSGFMPTRQLVCYKGDIQVYQHSQTVKVKVMQDYDWALITSFWDIKPTWQNSNSVINASKDAIISLGAYMNHQMVGYVLYNPTNQRIQQIAVDKKYRLNGIATALVSEIATTYGNSILIINVDEKSIELNNFLRNLGLDISLRQIEMELLLI